MSRKRKKRISGLEGNKKVYEGEKSIEKLKIEKEKVENIIDNELIVQKLIKDKEDLEAEFTEIIKFILSDMEKQENFIANTISGNESGIEIVDYYKNKYQEATRQIKTLKSHIEKLERRIHSLENSTLGKVTVKYWEMRKRSSVKK